MVATLHRALHRVMEYVVWMKRSVIREWPGKAHIKSNAPPPLTHHATRGMPRITAFGLHPGYTAEILVEALYNIMIYMECPSTGSVRKDLISVSIATEITERTEVFSVFSVISMAVFILLEQR